MIIGLAGKKGSGKNTVSKILHKHGFTNAETSFAYNLKQVCSKVFNMDPAIFYSQEAKESRFKEPLVITSGHVNHIFSICLTIHPFKLVNYDLKMLEGTELNSPREILQFVGTSIIRNLIDEKWHIHACLSNIHPKDNICITDVRFLNEYYELCNKKDSLIIYVKRETEFKDDHISETEVEKILSMPCVKVLDNLGSLDNLEGAVLDLMRKV